MSICAANHALSVEVRKFLENVGDVKEESVTDYLVWKWRELDKRFNYLRVTPFNHYAESTATGADFDLELWLVASTFQVSLAVQAKKFIRSSDSYVTRLRYPNGTKAQMDKLLDYARTQGRLPFYFIYTLPQATTKPKCNGKNGLARPVEDGAIFMAHAHVMEQFADGKHGKRVSRDKLLAASNPFHCMFCCPVAGTRFYFDRHFANVAGQVAEKKVELPSYARRLLDAARNSDGRWVELEPSEREQLRAFRAVGVYDMRQ